MKVMPRLSVYFSTSFKARCLHLVSGGLGSHTLSATNLESGPLANMGLFSDWTLCIFRGQDAGHSRAFCTVALVLRVLSIFSFFRAALFRPLERNSALAKIGNSPDRLAQSNRWGAPPFAEVEANRNLLCGMDRARCNQNILKLNSCLPACCRRVNFVPILYLRCFLGYVTPLLSLQS